MFLIDTGAISELCRLAPNAQVVAWFNAQDEESLYLSVIVLGEIQKGIRKLQDADKRVKLESWLNKELLPRFQGRILTIDASVAAVWGNTMAENELLARPAPAVDALIAATAIAHNLTVVTRNTKDFANFRVPTINPWFEQT